MSVFTVIWVVTVVWCFTRSDIKYMFFITLLFMTFQCDNVISYGDLTVGPQLATSAVFILKTAVHGRGILEYRTEYRKFIFSTIALFAAVLLSCIYNDTLNGQIVQIMPIFIYMICFLCMLFIYDEISNEELYLILRRIIIFLLFVGIIQFLTTTGYLPFRSILKTLLYNDNSSTVVFNKEYFNRVTSTFMEPSYYAGFLVGAFYYLLSLQNKLKENIYLLIIIFLEIILSMSSTAYVSFCIVGVIFLLFQDNYNLKQKIGLIIVAAVGLFVVYFGFYDYLDGAIFSKSETGSYNVRNNMNSIAFEYFGESFWFGIGYKGVRGSSIIFTLLGSMGIVGFMAYLLFDFILVLPNLVKKNNCSKMHIGVIFAVISIILCQMIACPDLDLCTYWFWIYAFAISFKGKSFCIKNSSEESYVAN